MPTAVTPTIEELVACKPQAWDVPFYDGTCRWYDSINQTAQEVLDCMIDEDLGLTWISIIVSPTNDIDVDPAILELTTFNLIWTILSIGQNWTYDLLELLNTSYYVTDWHNNYEIKNHENLRWVGIDGIHFNIWWWNIEIGLPTPVAQYFTPGRCTPGPLLAYYSWHFAWITTAITIVADSAWSAGNITLTFTAWMSVNDAIAARNLANPTNTITLASWDGTQEPGDGEFIALHWGADANTCQETDYMPNNKWLVLTRDCNTNSSQWMPPQCCLQQMSFSGWMITIDVNLPGEPLPSINTDNQQLSLVLDAPTSELLCLTRRHGGTLGIQIPDPDSCVDLININEHSFDLQGNLLYLLGSDLLINSVVDLNQVNEHTLELTSDPIDPLHPHDPLFPRHDILDIIGSDWLSNGTVDLNGVAQEMLTLMDNLLCVQKIINSTVQCNSCRNDCVDLSILEYDCEDVANCVGNTPTDRSIYLPNICTIITDPATQTVWNNFFCNGPVTINQTWIFISQWIQNIQNILIQITEIVQRQKYRARIYPSENRIVRSGHAVHTDLLQSLDWGQYARRYFPNFDQGEWWHSTTTETIDPARAIEDETNRLHLWTFNQVLPNSWAWYSTSPSAHNPNAPAEGKACNGWSKTIRVPMSWRYDIKLAGTIEVDHNVHAYRYSVLRLRAAESNTLIDFLMDSKFWADASVGSRSVNDVAYPITKEYNHSVNKIMFLERWDILIVAVRIDPATFWTTLTDQQEHLMNNSGASKFAHIVHTAGTVSGGEDVSRTPWTLYIDYSNSLIGYRNSMNTTEMPRPASMPPHLNYSMYYAPSGWVNWAENYGYGLFLTSSGNTDYFYDDGCINILANPSFAQSDWSGTSPSWFYTPWPTEKYWGSMLSIHRVNFKQ